MFGLEEYYDNLLNEARSEEEIYDVLRHKYVGRDGVPEEVLNKVFKADPTRKKSYTRWMLDKWPEESELIGKLKRIPLGRMFRYFQQRSQGDHPVNLVDIPSVEKAMEMMPADTDILAKDGNGPENDFDVVYDTPEWKIAVPHSYEASEKLGQGCKWCTAGYFGNGPRYFRNYTEDGPLWINLDYRNGGEIAPENNKEYPFKRYQFCFETEDGRGMFMDCNDDAVSLVGLDMPEEVVDFYRQQNESYAETIETNDGDSSDVYNRWREENRIVLFDNGQMMYRLSLLPAYDYNEEITEPYYCQLYPADDMYEEIMDNAFRPYDYMVRDFTKDTPMMAMILKDALDRECVVCYNGYQNSWEGSQGPYEYDEKHGVLMWWNGDSINIKWSKYPAYTYDGILPNYDILGMRVSEITDAIDDGCLYVEINENSEGKTLLKVDPKGVGKLLKSVIRSDVPKNGQHFMPIVRDGNVYVETVSATYNITKDGEVYSDRNPDWKHVNFEKKLNDHLYLVFERVSRVENVYDSETKSMIFKQWASVIGTHKGSDVLDVRHGIGHDGETLLYNYKSGKTSGPYKWVSFVESPAWFAMNENGSSVWMDDEFNVLERTEQHIENIGGYNHDHDRIVEIYRDGTGVHMLVMPDRKRLVPNGMEKYAKLWNGVYYFHNDTEGCLVDMVSFKTYPAPPNIVGASSMVKAESYKAAPGRWFVVVDDGGKVNMCAAGRLLLSHFVEDICRNDGTNNPDFFIFMDGNMYVYRMSDGAVLPQKYGVSGFVDTSNRNIELPVFKVRGNSEGDYVNVIYDYRKNAIADIESNGVEYDRDTVVEAVFGPKSNFFENTFKSWMDRMSVVSD